jgi:HprK-related kinase A
MKVSALPSADLARLLCGDGLRLRSGPFVFQLRSPVDLIHEGVALLYGDYPLVAGDAWVDFDVEIAPGRGMRRWLKPQVRFIFDGRPVFEPMPYSHAFALIEWAMNWCISVHDHHHLTLHAAVIEREGFAAILPAPPGSGKSTLCAGLIHAGWRLLSDELTLIALDSSRAITPLCRPVSLKNASIDVIRQWSGQTAVFNRIAHETAKGSVGHMRVASADLARMDETAQPRWIVFPRWQANAPAVLTPRSRAESLLSLSENAFNYVTLSDTGFHALADTVASSDCFDFRYSRLEDAVRCFDRLVTEARP